MRYLLGLVVACGLASVIPATHAQAEVQTDARAVVRDGDRDGNDRDDDNRWRYRRHNGKWWYWTPDQSWVYWSGGRWVPYQSRGTVARSYYRGSPVTRYSYRDDFRGSRYDNGYRFRDGYYRDGYYRDGYYRDDFYRGYGNPYRSGYRGYGRAGVYIGPGGAGIRF